MEQIATLIEHRDIDSLLAKRALETLVKHYPNHPWIVQAISSQGHLTIQCPTLSYKYGMRINLDKTMHDLDVRVMKFGGEFLERFSVKRGATDPDANKERYKQGRFR